MNLRLYSRLFACTPLNRRVWRLSLPVMLGMMTTTMVMLADSYMVGQLGADALAAAGMGGMVFWTVLSFFMGASFGVQIITARRFGEERYSAAGRVLVSTVYATIVLGALFSGGVWLFADELIYFLAEDASYGPRTVDFLRIRALGLMLYFLVFVLRAFFDGVGRTEIGMLSSILIMLSNIFGNWLLIYGNWGFPRLETDGAAIASGLAAIPGVLVFFFYFPQKAFRAYFSGVFDRFAGFDSGALAEIAYVGLPAAVDNFMMNLSFTLFYRLAALAGMATVAATNIVVSILSVSFMPGFGFGVAATTVLGIRVARGQYRIAQAGTYRSAAYAAVMMGALGALFVVFAEPLVRSFTDDPAVIAEALPALIIVALVQAADGWQMTLSMALRSAGLVYFVLIVYALSSFGLMLPTGWFFGIHLGLGAAGLWMGLALWLAVLSLIFELVFRTDRWKHVQV